MTAQAEFSHRTRTQNLDRLAREHFDLLIIGGGITGAGIVRDAAARGLTCALVERLDFAIGTSSRSSKLIHGGLRYLAQGDVGLVKEASNERQAVRKLAPHLATPLQVLVPVYSRGGYLKIRAGLWAFDKLANVASSERHRMMGRDGALKLEPSLRPDTLYGAGLYYEYLTDDARLVLANIQSAATMGSAIANYTEVVGLKVENGKAAGAILRDRVGENEIHVRAKVVVNAAGPWVDEIRVMQGGGEKRILHLAQGIHITIPHERLPLSRMVTMTSPDKRPVFAIPRDGLVYMGTTDTDYEGRYDEPPILQRDVDYLIESVRLTFQGASLRPDEIVGAWSGIRPLVHQEGKKTSEISRKDEVMVGPTGLLSIAGGKLTTFRKMAERVVDMVGEQLEAQGQASPSPRNDRGDTTLVGGDTGLDVEAYAEATKRRFATLDPTVLDHLVRTYGSCSERIADSMTKDPTSATRFAAASPVTPAEVEHAVHQEMALTLSDFLERRSRSFLWNPANGVDIAESAAAKMGSLLGWDSRRIADEIASYQHHVQDVKTFISTADRTVRRTAQG